jgi:hypothetical protein
MTSDELHVTDKRRSVDALLQGWETRHRLHPAVSTQIDQYCDGERHCLMYRGEKCIRYRDDLFVIGEKARPFYYGNDPTRFHRTAREIQSNESKMRQLVDVFLSTPMAKGGATRSADLIMARWKALEPRGRFRLAQLLLHALHWQNCKQEVKEWRDFLFVHSCSLNDCVALGYALSHRADEPPPEKAFVIEYAPPCDQDFFEPVGSLIEEFKELNLPNCFVDREQEVFALWGLFPHYILGYSELTRDDADAVPARYKVKYVPNPAFDGGASLEMPKDLTDDQSKKARQIGKELAWVQREIGVACPSVWIEHSGDVSDVSATRHARRGPLRSYRR